MATRISQSMYGQFGSPYNTFGSGSGGTGSLVGSNVQPYSGQLVTAPVRTTAQPVTSAGVVSQPGPYPQQPAYQPAPMWNAAYEATIAELDRRAGRLQGNFKWDESSLSQAYGLDAGGREITDPHAVLFNPFNRMALLREAFKHANTAQVNSMAGRGQLYSGATQSRLDNQRHEFDVTEDSLKRDYQAQRRALIEAFLEEQGSMAAAKAAAELAALQAQLAAGAITQDQYAALMAAIQAQVQQPPKSGSSGGYTAPPKPAPAIVPTRTPLPSTTTTSTGSATRYPTR